MSDTPSTVRSEYIDAWREGYRAAVTDILGSEPLPPPPSAEDFCRIGDEEYETIAGVRISTGNTVRAQIDCVMNDGKYVPLRSVLRRCVQLGSELHGPDAERDAAAMTELMGEPGGPLA